MSRKQTSDELRQHLIEQIDFLQNSASNFDFGKEYEAKRMAVIARTLLHETEYSKSLLGQLRLRKKMKFFNTAMPYQPDNFLTQQCLVLKKMTTDSFLFIPLFEECRAYPLTVIEWLKQTVLSDSKGNTYCRKDIILFLANQDGGAHVDGTIDTRYAKLKDADVTGWKVIQNDGTEQDPNNNAVYASMRQIAYELLQSLYLEKPLLFSRKIF